MTTGRLDHVNYKGNPAVNQGAGRLPVDPELARKEAVGLGPTALAVRGSPVVGKGEGELCMVHGLAPIRGNRGKSRRHAGQVMLLHERDVQLDPLAPHTCLVESVGQAFEDGPPALTRKVSRLVDVLEMPGAIRESAEEGSSPLLFEKDRQLADTLPSATSFGVALAIHQQSRQLRAQPRTLKHSIRGLQPRNRFIVPAKTGEQDGSLLHTRPVVRAALEVAHDHRQRIGVQILPLKAVGLDRRKKPLLGTALTSPGDEPPGALEVPEEDGDARLRNAQLCLVLGERVCADLRPAKKLPKIGGTPPGMNEQRRNASPHLGRVAGPAIRTKDEPLRELRPSEMRSQPGPNHAGLGPSPILQGSEGCRQAIRIDEKCLVAKPVHSGRHAFAIGAAGHHVGVRWIHHL